MCVLINKVSMERKNLRFFIKTYGCQMNVHDSTRMANLLEQSNFVEVFDPVLADILIFNTCSVRENARNKVLSEIGSVCATYKKRPVIVVAGCVGVQDGEGLISGQGRVDVVLGPDQVSRVPELILSFLENRKSVVETGFLKGPFRYSLDEVCTRHGDSLPSPATAYISIMQGCNNFCSFCIVPYTRGREKSRMMKEILREAEYLVSRGVKEIILLGQNVNSFGKDSGEDFVTLLKKIDKTGVERLRFLTAHPKDLSDSCVDAFFSLPSLCPHLHLPVQSGSDKVLEGMNRKYTRADYLSIIEKIRKRNPLFSFGTDIIVGFPGETDDGFAETLALLREVRFDNVFSFKYSPRPGTRAMDYPENIARQVSIDRLSILNELQRSIFEKEARNHMGSLWDVLVEKESRYRSGYVGGRTPEFRYVNFKGASSLIGRVMRVRISGFSKVTYRGVLVE